MLFFATLQLSGEIRVSRDISGYYYSPTYTNFAYTIFSSSLIRVIRGPPVLQKLQKF